MSKINTAWTKNLSLEEKERMEYNVTKTNMIIERLGLILAELEQGEFPPASDYDSPSWAYKQADRNGALRIIKKLKDILP